MNDSQLPELNILLCSPRGFCAGVDRAIQIVEKTLEKYSAPVYVRHEIVHNKHVINDLKQKGAIFVEELSEIPNNDRPVIFSAHGVAKSVPMDAEKRNMFYIDATCPLVTKVHNEAERHYQMGRKIILIGHKGHPEVIGTIGQLPDDAFFLVENVDDVKQLNLAPDTPLAYCSQTTLSLDDTALIILELKNKFTNIIAPAKEDICYATTNRQMAVREIAPKSDAVFVIGAPNSSNSNRLVETAKTYGCPNAHLIENNNSIPWDAIKDIKTLGLTAGASAPDILIKNVIDAMRHRYNVTITDVVLAKEDIAFNIPRILRDNEDGQE